jgi:Flp pilus assembly protein TadG
MKLHKVSFSLRLLKDTSGQSAPMLAFSMLAFIGISGMTIDLGHAYVARQQLQTSTNAAALAGAAALPNTTTATAQVKAYSAMTGQKYATPNLTNVSLGSTPAYKCLATLISNMGLGCATATGIPTGSYNAVTVTQTATVPLWFGGMFHIPAFNIGATATAGMSGGNNTPWNVAIVIDTTSSMTSSDSGLQCTGTRESCTLQGIQILLELMYPCAAGATCTSGGTPVDSVSLFVFPSVLTSQAKDYYGGTSLTCPTTIPTIEPYTFQNVTTTSPNYNPPVTYTYQVVPTPLGTTGNTVASFAHDYKVTDASSTLNAGSQIVVAAGGKSGCTGIQGKGGEGTYYAQAIYQAQTALIAQQKANPGSQNAMIILGDGDMSASSGQLVAQSGTLNGTGSGSNKNTYTYPSLLGQCGQAIIAAQAAAVTPNANGASGTRVYTVAYGSTTSGTCSTDATYSAYKGVNACTTMADMASSPGYFYSDNGSGNCSSPNQLNFTKLTQIFQAISRNLTTPRLVPNGTT